MSSKNLEGDKITEGINLGIIQCPIMAREGQGYRDMALEGLKVVSKG